MRIDPTGKVYVASGACPQGQGMETIFSQVVADAWKVKPDDVVMALADTSAISIGFGTIASRSTVTLSSAIHYASEILREKAFAIAANMLECAPGDLELRNGTIGVVGVPGNEVTLASVAKAARPGWDHGRPQGMQAGLEETYYYEPPTVTWSYASHAAIVEVDIRTGRLDIEKYVVVHDCGVVVNPMLVEGQILGGTVQGLGGALLEEFAYDSEGQLLTGSFMDYLLPTASDIPACRTDPLAFSLAAQSARRQGRRRRQRDFASGCHRQRGVRCARAIQNGIQLDAHQTRADRRSDAVGAVLISGLSALRLSWNLNSARVAAPTTKSRPTSRGARGKIGLVA